MKSRFAIIRILLAVICLIVLYSFYFSYKRLSLSHDNIDYIDVEALDLEKKVANAHATHKVSSAFEPTYFNEQFCFNQRVAHITAFKQPYDMYLHKRNEDIYISESIMNGQRNGNFFEAKIRQQIERAIGNRKHVVILDIGANIGLHAAYLASLGHTVHAFEPFPKNFKLLECTIAKNNFTNFKLNKFGLSNHNGEFCMDVPDSSNNGHAIVLDNAEMNECRNPVKLQRLDEYLEKYAVNDAYIVKVDVEGYEFNALITAKKFFEKHPPGHFFSEFSPDMIRQHGLDPVKFLEFFWDLGYTVELGDGTLINKSNFGAIINQGMNDIHAYFS